MTPVVWAAADRDEQKSVLYDHVNPTKWPAKGRNKVRVGHQPGCFLIFDGELAWHVLGADLPISLL